jgi:hypothetical protein
MKLPDETVVLPDRADPSDDRAIARGGHAADPVAGQRLHDLFPCFRHLCPRSEGRERVVEHSRGGFDAIRVCGDEVLN